MSKSNGIVAATVLLSLFSFAFVWTHRSASESTGAKGRTAAPRAEAVTLTAEKRGFPLMNLRDGKRFEARLASDAEFDFATASPTGLTTADLNLDGARDLVAAYAANGDGYLAIYRGSLNTLSARTPEIFEAMKEGQFPEPFLREVRVIKTPAPPHFVGTGDFNRDGSIDIVTVARNDNRAFLFSGDRSDSYDLSYVDLPGRVTAMITANIDPMDNVPDLAFAVSTDKGASLLIYNDSTAAFARTPDTFPLPGPATSLALGQLDDHDPMDLVAAGGGSVTIIHGEYRDRESVNGRTETLIQGFDVAAVLVGEFVWDREHRHEIAMLDSSGTVHILARGSLNTRQFTEDEHRRRPIEIRSLMAQEDARRRLDYQPFAATKPWEKWRQVDRIHVGSRNASTSSPAAHFTSARMTPFGVEDLLVLDAAARKINVLVSNNDDLKESGDSYALSASGARALVTLDLTDTPVAVLPMRLSVMNRPGIVLLDEASNEISYALVAPTATFTVNTTADTYDGSCTAGAGGCSLRDALDDANAGATADLVMVPAGTYTISPALGGPDQDTTIDPAAQQSGDWDVFFDTTIAGAGQATTILQAAAAQPGHDRVLDAIQTGVGIPDLTISGLTIRHGRCQVGCVDGGGLRYAVDNQSVLTINDSTVDNNRTEVGTGGPANNGGGIFGGQSDFVYTNLTATNNFTAFVSSGCTGATQCGGEGGGMFSGVSFAANPTSVTMTNCTITGNTVNAVNGLGGRGGAYAGSPNSVTINGGNFSNNVAFTDAGAFRLFTPTTITGPTTISNNTARQNGGGIWSDPLANDNTPLTNTFSSLTMQGNTADSDGVIAVNNVNRGDGGAIFHGRGTLNLTGSTIGGTGVGQANTAFDGGGIARTYSQFVAAVFNASTLNINGGSIVGNLAINNGGGVINDATKTAATGNASNLNIGGTTAVTMTNNNARNHGGAIAVVTGAGSTTPAASASLNNMTLRNNIANSDSSGGGDGGAFYQSSAVSGGGTAFTGGLSIGGSGFANAAANGGGISNAAGILTLPANTSITFNTATANGGGINNGGTINSFTTPNISNNSAIGNGGGINNTAGALTASGATINGNTAANGSAIQAAGGTVTLAGVSNITGNINIAGGTLTGAVGSNTVLTGNYSQSSGTFTGNNATFNITGNFAYTGGTFTAGTSTFNFNGGGAQSISTSSAITFSNLSDSNTAQPLAVNGSINASSNLTINANTTFAPVAAAVIGGTGTLTGSGIVRVTRATGTNDFLTQYTITNKTLTNLTVDYVGAGAQGVSATTYGNLRINNASGASLSGNVVVGGMLALQSGNLAVGTNILTLNGGVVSTGGTLSSSATGTVNYNQSTNGQVVLSGSYGNLTFSNFNKDLTNANINIAGAFTPGTGTAVTTGTTITFNGAALQTIPVFNYNNLGLNNAAGANLGGSVTVGGSLTLTNGPLNVLTNTLTLNGAASQTSGVLTSSATGTVNYNQGSNDQAILSGSYGNLIFSNFTKDLTGRTVSVAGVFTPGTAVGHTITGSTFIYNGTAAQTLPAGFATYNNLTLNNTAGTTGFAGLTVNGLLLVQAGTFTSSSTYNNVQINAGATLAGTNATTINVSGNWVNNGTFTASGNTVNFNGGALQTISGTSATVFNNLTINNSNGINLSANATVNNTLTLTLGALGVGTNTLTLNGAATQTGGSLTSGPAGTVNYNQSSDGQVVLPANYGNLTFSNFSKDLTNATIGIGGTFSPGTAPNHVVTGSTISFNGTAVQNAPVFPYHNLTINSVAGVNLTGDTAVTGALTFTNGELNTGANTLTVGTSGSSTRTGGHLVGSLRKQFNAPAAFIYHVGTAGAYSPLTQAVTAMTAATGELTVRPNTGVPVITPVPLDPAKTLQRYWTLSGSGIRSNLTFQYLQPPDVPATTNEALWYVIRVTGNSAVRYQPGPDVVIDGAANTFTVNDVESYSDWTAGEPLAPTAANATVSGRVADVFGYAIAGVQISMQDSAGNFVTARTNPFGFYVLPGVRAGHTYLISLTHRRYTFQSRSVTVDEDLANVDFVAEPQK